MKTRISFRFYYKIMIICSFGGHLHCNYHQTQPIIGVKLSNTFFEGVYTKAELGYYGIWKRSILAAGIAFHFDTDSTFLFYSCGTASPHIGKYYQKSDTIFVKDCTHSILPAQFRFLTPNKIIGEIFINGRNKKCIFICEQKSSLRLTPDLRPIISGKNKN